jgi:methylisocitrate lyase
MKKTTLLKKLILDKEILVMPGAHDALSAKIIELVGFKALILGGYSATASRLGKPDVSFLTMTEMADCLRSISDVVDIPVFADGDTGYGNVTNVRQTVRAFEKAGVAALFIEDQVFPKRCGHMDGKQIIPTLDMVAKIKAAVDARVDEDLVIMARTDAVATDSVNEAIERANIYREAGADLILVEAVTSVEQMKRTNESINAPTMANMVEGGKTPILTVKELQDVGYSVVCIPNATVYATAWALRGLWGELKKEGTTRNWIDRMICFDDFNKLVGLDKVRERESHYYKDLFESLGQKNQIEKGENT